MADIRHLSKEDLNGRRGAPTPGEVVLRHLEGPSLAYTLTRWHKNVGDQVRARDIIATVETTNFSVDIEVFEEGIVTHHFFTAGSHIPNGASIARISPEKKEPNQPLQRNASTRSVSSFESPARRG